MADRDEPPRWHKSSRSSAGACVEVLARDHEVLVRDTKNPDGPVLSFDRAAFAAFLDAVKLGEFDLH